MNPRLVAHSGPLVGQTLPLSEGETLLGRDPSNRVCLADLAVSRQHCRIHLSGGQVQIADLDSLNGTFVNGVPVKERTLSQGDQIRIGDSCFSLLLQDEGELSLPSRIQWEDDASLDGVTVELRHQDALYLQPGKAPAAAPPSLKVLRHLNTLLALGQTIHSLRHRDKLAHRLLELVLEAIPAERGALLWHGHSEADPFSVLATVEIASQPMPFAVSHTVVRRLVEQRVGILNNHVPQSEALKDAPSLIGARIRSLLAVPLLLYDKVLGVIYLVTCNPARHFEEEHLQLLTAVAGMAAVALENAGHFEALHEENQRLKSEIALEHNMIGESPRMREVLQFISKAAPTEATVLIRGESGTGKELVARALHRNSPRRDKPFVAINCAALTESLLESELFGYEKGAFTNALGQKKGKLEVADGGTVFLDEIGELAPALQAKLLRVLQEREFDRVGGTRPVRIDIRLIAATNKRLEEAMKEGAFRQDLYYRLNVISVTLPPLRERASDIPLLASYFIDKYSKTGRRRVAGLSTEARALLLHYDWPGNVRELENAIERAVVLGSTETLLPEDLPETLLERDGGEGIPLTKYHEAVNETKKQLIIRALENSGGSYTEAARFLGLHPNYLHRLIRNLALKPELKKRTAM